jgi:outer membrane murein-binding lipoprotein Lpp
LGTKFISRLVLGAALAGGLIMAGVPSPARTPDDRAAREARLRSAREKLDFDVQHHGDHSRQAEKDRAKMEQTRQWCRDHHSDWDHGKYDRD